MAKVMYLQPVDTSTSSFSSTATIRRHVPFQRSNDSLWSSFLTDSLTTAQKRRLSLSDRPVRDKDESSSTSDNTSPKESFKSAYSQQMASISTSCDGTDEAVSMRKGAQPQIDKNLYTKEHNSEKGLRDHECTIREIDEGVPGIDQPMPFRRWLSTLRRRKQKPPQVATPCRSRQPLDDFDAVETTAACFPARKSHEKSPSWTSSSGIIATMRSATVTVASASIAPLSRHTSWRRFRQIQSSIVSGSDARPSIDSQRQVLDQAARQRSRKRRDKIEELIRSEESYVADIKALCNVSGDRSTQQPANALSRHTSHYWVTNSPSPASLEQQHRIRYPACIISMTIYWVSCNELYHSRSSIRRQQEQANLAVHDHIHVGIQWTVFQIICFHDSQTCPFGVVGAR